MRRQALISGDTEALRYLNRNTSWRVRYCPSLSATLTPEGQREAIEGYRRSRRGPESRWLPTLLERWEGTLQTLEDLAWQYGGRGLEVTPLACRQRPLSLSWWPALTSLGSLDPVAVLASQTGEDRSVYAALHRQLQKEGRCPALWEVLDHPRCRAAFRSTLRRGGAQVLHLRLEWLPKVHADDPHPVTHLGTHGGTIYLRAEVAPTTWFTDPEAPGYAHWGRRASLSRQQAYWRSLGTGYKSARH